MPTQWSKSGSVFSPADESVKNLPAGAYQIGQDPYGRILISAQELKSESLLTFDDSPTRWLAQEIERFWSSQDLYKRMGLAWRRGILMYGPPGTGKSGIIQMASRDVIAKNGVVINCNHIGLLRKAMPLFLELERNTPMVIILEDIEELLRQDEHGLLQLLDGVGDVKPGVLYVASTNSIDRVPDRIKNRPSRFDTVMLVEAPSAKSRAKYLLHVLRNTPFDGPEHAQATIRHMVASSKGFTFAHLKELAIAVAIYGKDVDTAVSTIAKMGNIEVKRDPDADDDDEDADVESDVPCDPVSAKS